VAQLQLKGLASPLMGRRSIARSRLDAGFDLQTASGGLVVVCANNPTALDVRFDFHALVLLLFDIHVERRRHVLVFEADNHRRSYTQAKKECEIAGPGTFIFRAHSPDSSADR